MYTVNTLEFSYFLGPAFVVSVTTLVISILLVGGAKQGSMNMLFAWVVWKILVILIFWLW